MDLQLIRSATLRLDYGGKRLLIDPYLAAKHTGKSYAGVSVSPLVDLPCPPEDVVAGVELVVISHLHSDHFDATAADLLPKDIPLLCQPEDKDSLASMGFRDVISVAGAVDWHGITITRTPCQHGIGEVLKEMGNASGFVFRAEKEPIVYWMGDTVWCPAVAAVIARAQPEVIITHSCGAVWGDQVPIVMDAAQTVAVCRSAPRSTVVATHMEAVDHATVSRAALRRYATEHGIGTERLLIPLDGETVTF